MHYNKYYVIVQKNVIIIYRISQYAIYLYLHLMRKHNGMRPQDIVILLAIISSCLIDYNKRNVSCHALYEFPQFGLP